MKERPLAAVRQSFGTLRCGPSKRPFVPLAAFSETEGRQCGTKGPFRGLNSTASSDTDLSLISYESKQ